MIKINPIISRIAGPGSVSERLEIRDRFFRQTIESRQLLQPFENFPGVLYFVKDVESRLMAISRESITRMGFESEEEIIGRTVQDYLPKDLAEKFLSDDQWVLRNGKPLRNIVEMWFNEQGVRDWITTDKYPLRNAAGDVV